MLTGLAGIQRFAANYIRDTYAGHYTLFGWDLGTAQAATSVTFAIIILFGLLVTYPAVRLSDRVGRRRMLIAAGLCGAGGALLFFLAASLSQLVVFAVLVAVCFGTFVSVDWAFMADLAPRRRAGKFLGFSNLATAGAQAAAPAVLGPVIDVVNRGTSNTGGYRVLFLVAAFFFIIGAVVLSRARAEPIADVDDEAASRAETTAVHVGR
jgi:MFS family permease